MATMKRSSGKSSSGLVAAAAALLMVVVAMATLAAVADAQCGVNELDVLSNCQQYVKKGGDKMPPSAQCCEALKGADVPCACKNILTPSIQGMIDMNKAVYVRRTCGLSIPTGMKCGSFVVPPQMRRR